MMHDLRQEDLSQIIPYNQWQFRDWIAKSLDPRTPRIEKFQPAGTFVWLVYSGTGEIGVFREVHANLPKESRDRFSKAIGMLVEELSSERVGDANALNLPYYQTLETLLHLCAGVGIPTAIKPLHSHIDRNFYDGIIGTDLATELCALSLNYVAGMSRAHLLQEPKQRKDAERFLTKLPSSSVYDKGGEEMRLEGLAGLAAFSHHHKG